MKIINKIAIILAGSLMAFILCLETYYLYASNKLDLNEVIPDYVYSQAVYDSLWVSLREKGEIELEATSATGLVFSLFSYSFFNQSREYSDHFSKGSLVSNQVARLLNLNHQQRSIDKHISKIVTGIWLSRNAKANHLLGVFIEKSFFGKKLYGLESASNYYFNKRPSNLDLNEVVSLISLLKAPSLYSPYCNPERFKKRAEYLYSQLQQNWKEKYGGHSFSLPQVVEKKDREDKCI